MLYFKGELLTLQDRLMKSRVENEDSNRRLRMELDSERSKGMELQDRNNELSVSI